VYAGNLPGRVGEHEHTRCPGCGRVLIERVGFRVLRCTLREGACPDCGRAIPGVWPSRDGSVRTHPVERGAGSSRARRDDPQGTPAAAPA